jgi:hypothetical protein
MCVPAGTTIFAVAGITARVEVASCATGAAEPAAAVPDGAGASLEAGVALDGAGAFCVVGWLAGAGGIGPASCAAAESKHPVATNNRRASCK